MKNPVFIFFRIPSKVTLGLTFHLEVVKKKQKMKLIFAQAKNSRSSNFTTGLNPLPACSWSHHDEKLIARVRAFYCDSGLMMRFAQLLSRHRLTMAALLTAASIPLHGIVVHAYRKELSPRFQPNSADALITEELRTGDLVLFSRKWYCYCLPMAASIRLYAYSYGCDYDHAGIIVLGDDGTPHVFELTPFGGYKLRSFEDRIRHSQSTHIIVIPFIPSLLLDPTQKGNLDSYISQKTQVRPSSSIPSAMECFDCWMGLSTYYLDCMRGGRRDAQSSHFYCSNIKMIVEALSVAGYRPVLCRHGISKRKQPVAPRFVQQLTLKAVEDRSIAFAAIESPSEEVRLSVADVLIRSA